MIRTILHLISVILTITLIFIGLGWYLAPEEPLQKADAIVAISGDEGSRVQTAISLHQDGWAPLLVFSGAARDPQSPSNALTMKWAAVGAGIDPSLILLEETSRNTFENARHSAKIIRARRIERIILITSPYHQRRAYLEFREALGSDVDIINYPARNTSWGRTNWWLTPIGWLTTVTETPKLALSWLRMTAN